MDKVLVFSVLAATLLLFVWDKIRYEAVAISALLVLVLAGIVPAADAFSGLGHPAVITVAAVLIITRGLANVGVADLLARPLEKLGSNLMVLMALLTGAVTLLSAFINNVGALALLMPVALRLARTHKHPPSLLLMPMAFASLLGGLMTAVGTPPNMIVSAYRERESGLPFAMFDFFPVGAASAVLGLVFLILLGWRLLPRRKGEGGSGISFTLSGYVTEVRVPDNSPHAGMTLSELEDKLGEGVGILGVIRGKRRIGGHHASEPIVGGDIVVVKGKAQDLKEAVDKLKFEMAGRGKDTEQLLQSDDLYLVEAVVLTGGWATGKSARSLALRERFGLNLLAVSRHGSSLSKSIAEATWKAGDVLLLEGDRAQIPDALSTLGCLPLAARDLRIGQPTRLLTAATMLGTTVVIAAVGLVPIHIGFILCTLAMGAAGMFSAREAYSAVDWPIILLLAAMIPIGTAMESSGGAAWLAQLITQAAVGSPPVLGLIAIMVATMCLSDIVNNAAAAILMCPIATGVAAGLSVSSDPFLMAVAIGASSAFLTPVGHQSNTLVMGPGGYRFRDYWRLGLPVEIIVGVTAVFLIPLVWPF